MEPIKFLKLDEWRINPNRIYMYEKRGGYIHVYYKNPDDTSDSLIVDEANLSVLDERFVEQPNPLEEKK